MGRLNKEQIAMNLLTSATKKEAAERSGVSISTIKRLQKDPEFVRILHETKERLFQEAMQKIQAYCLESATVLYNIMNDEYEKGSTRVSAARALMDTGVSVNEAEEFSRRLDDLERRMLER